MIIQIVKILWEDQRGSSDLITSSILMNIWIALLGIMMSFGLLIYSCLVVADSSRDGGRHAALNYGPAQERVEQSIQEGGLRGENIQMITETSDTNYVTVNVQYKQPSIVPLLPKLIGGNPWPDNFLIDFTTVFKKEKP
ncbi:pilus assembly protein [Desulforamulus aquiferis]|uniref:Pilus assembly protein n=1 Tax=Desulforamulus aquiferis TaxID=1397668 RepID=A0AAW7Z8K1_9FIRM|nr:pilus assembly protein [Desulforamulus aquiferis]MDO7785806.1 pilus assembly protein [Desulforamulus aquiferis]